MSEKLFLVRVVGSGEDGHPKTLATHGPLCQMEAEHLASDLAFEMHRQMGNFYNTKVASVKVEEA